MKKILFSSLFVIITLSAGQAQSLEEILSQHEKTMGYDQLAAIKTARITGTNLRGKGGVPFTIYIKGQKIRYESDMRGQKSVQVYDGQRGWFISPRSGEVRAMPQMLVERLEERARLGSYLARWQEMKPHLSLEESKEIKVNKKKVPVYVVKLEIPDLSTDLYYIDKESYLLLREVIKTNYNGRQLKRKVDYGDYRDIDGVKIAFDRVSYLEGSSVQGPGGTPQGRPGGGKGMGGGGKGADGGKGGSRRYGGGMEGQQGGPAGSPGGGKTEIRFSKVEANIPVDDQLFTRDSLR